MGEELHLALLGNVEVRRTGVPVTGFRSSKVRALLCYLAVTGRPHLRPTLAGLLWGEMPEASAQNNLRKALTNLRQLVGPYLSITRQDVAFNRDSSYWLDVEIFEAQVEEASAGRVDIERLQKAVALYRGDFLEGFYVRQAPAFEEWALAQRARLRELALQALHTLAVHHTRRGKAGHAAGIDCTTRLLALEPWREEAHRQLILLLAQSGQRGAALAQYETCCQVLSEELGVGPAKETVALYEKIRTGELEVAIPTPEPEITPHLPAFLERVESKRSARPVFVARERELVRLNGFIETALSGHGQVVFITGGPGRGKTVLIQEFARRAMDAHPDLLVATGGCNAYSGIGDPYLPFREVMGTLTGDVEGRWAAGAVMREHAQRLWAALPLAAQALLDHGPALIDLLVSGRALLSRAVVSAPNCPGWLGRLRELIEQGRAEPGEQVQSHLFEQFTSVLRALTTQRPLLLALDDLQWADNASISMLFHLGRELGSSRILIVGAYRPEEVALGRSGERHPLEKVLTEFKRHFGDVSVDLRRADEKEGQQFVEAFLDTEPHRLGEGFRRALFGRTGGHPLFTVELLRTMQERGELVEDDDGRWVEGPALDWNTLPARVEGVIQERIGQLGEELREILAVASVEGEQFTAQVVARVQETGERQLLRALSRALEKRHRLVREGEELQVGRHRLSRYWFAHALFQGYLYNGLGAGERALLHREVAGALEELYEGRTEEIVPQLARHYAEAGEGEKAVEYLSRAGDQARLAYAHTEAADHYRRGLAFLKERGEYGRAARVSMTLGLTHHNAFDFKAARQAYDEGFVLWQRAVAVQPAILPPAPHALRLRLRSEPTTLDPAMCADSPTGRILNHLFSGLVEKRPEMDIMPDVAESWEILEGGRQYVFHLRDDARWSDGAPVTAGDFEYAWKRMLDPATGSPRANDLYDIKGARAFHQGEGEVGDVGVRALDEVTLAVELEAPTGHFLQAVAGTKAVPRHAVEAFDEAWAQVEDMVTNGPFRLESWKPGELMVLTRNRAYHGRFTGNVDRVELLALADSLDPEAKALEMYEADGLDAVFFLHPAEIEGSQHRHAEEYVSVPGIRTVFVGFDMRQPPFDDSRVRRAFALATDRERLADVVLRGHFFPATGGFVPPAMPGHSPGIGLPYDPDRARQLLAEAGYPDGLGFPAIEALFAGFSRACEYLQALWQENLGIEVTWHALDWATFADRLAREPPKLFTGAWAGGLDPVSFLGAYFEQHPVGWRNQAYTKLLEGTKRAVDQGERMKLYAQADRILVEEAPVVPLFYGRWHWLMKPWLTRFPISAASGADFWKDAVIEPHE